MIKTKEYNNISDELRKKHTLKPGKVAVFALDNLVRDPMAQQGEPQFFLPASKHVQKVQTIYDPYKGDNVQIRAIQSVTSEGVIKDYRISFDKEMMGKISLSGDNPDHQRIFTFMMLSNENSSNKGRLKAVNAVFSYVDHEAKAKAARKEREVKRIAMNAAYDMDDKAIRAMSAALNINPKLDMDILRDRVEAHADGSPVEFMRMLGDKNLGVQAIVNQAFRLNILRYLSSKMQVIWVETGQVIHVVAPGKKPRQSMADFLLANTDAGTAAMDSIRAALSTQGAELESSFKSLIKLGKDVGAATARDDDEVAVAPLPPPISSPPLVAMDVVPPVKAKPAAKPASKPAAKRTTGKGRGRPASKKSS